MLIVLTLQAESSIKGPKRTSNMKARAFMARGPDESIFWFSQKLNKFLAVEMSGF